MRLITALNNKDFFKRIHVRAIITMVCFGNTWIAASVKTTPLYPVFLGEDAKFDIVSSKLKSEK